MEAFISGGLFTNILLGLILIVLWNVNTMHSKILTLYRKRLGLNLDGSEDLT